MKINEIKINSIVDITVLLKSMEEKTARNGSKYISLNLTDGEIEVIANVWSMTKEGFPVEAGQIMNCKLECRSYNEAKTYVASECVVNNDADRKDFIKLPPVAIDKMYESIYTMAQSLGVYKDLLVKILDENKDALLNAAAAKAVHHNMCGGLLYHIYSMIKSAHMVQKVYQEIDRNLLIASVIVHDLGKLKELNTDSVGNAEYTIDGMLFGHSYIGAEMVAKTALEVGLPEKETRLLKHCIISHHNLAEWGAIQTPMIPEAFLLHQLDMIDSKLYVYRDVKATMEPDTMSDKVFGLGNIRIYNP